MGEPVRADANGGKQVAPPTRDPLPDGPPSPKRKTGRPSKIEKAAEEKAQLEAEVAQRETEATELAAIAGEALAIPFRLLAERRGEHWALSDTEKGQFSLAVSRIVVKYLPGFLLKYKEEAAFILISVAIFAPRLGKDKQLAAERSGTVRGDGHPRLREDDAGESHRRPAVAG